MSGRNAFFGFWIVLGLTGLVVVGANVAVSLHRISGECAAPGRDHARGGPR